MAIHFGLQIVFKKTKILFDSFMDELGADRDYEVLIITHIPLCV